MASMGDVGQLDPEPLIRYITHQPILNKNLIIICKAEGLSGTGVKSDLQRRIVQNIRLHASTGSTERFNRLKAMIYDHRKIVPAQPPTQPGQYSSSAAATSPGASTNGYSGGYAMGNGNGNGMSSMNPANGHRPAQLAVEFKPSPYYTVIKQVGDMKTVDIMAQHRNSVSIPIKPQDCPDLQADKNLRVMVFCAGEGSRYGQDIAFPHQSEIKVNQGDVKANLRGLKNKPGSTRPVDITDYLRLKPPGYSNTVDMTYALTTKKFYLMVFIVRIVPVEALVKKLEGGKRISKDSVIREMVNKARDLDVEETSIVLSLKCPLSTLRIDLPCRSVSCKHIQCFDATSYLQMQEQGPTWLCPLCDNPAPFETLAVDEYLRDIIKNTPKETDQVTVEPNGTWSLPDRGGSLSDGAAFGSEDDDLMEIKDTRVTALKKENTPLSSPSTTRTPQASRSREPSASSGPPRASSSKRPAPQIIDLTLSDDDDEPLRPAKRQHTNGYGTPQSLPPRYGQSSS